jgi:hypothetical protein
MKVIILGITFIISAIILSFGYWRLLGNPKFYPIGTPAGELYAPAMFLGIIAYGTCLILALVGGLILLIFK